MKKHIFLVIMLLLTIVFMNSGCARCAREYNGGHGQGYAMGECAGRLDGNNEETRQYHGGTGGGYAMGEYAGPVDNINKKP